MRTLKLAARIATAHMFFLLSLCVAGMANAAEPTQQLDEKVTVGGAELKLVGGGLMEGVGIYRRANRRVAIGMYFPQRKTTTEEYLSLPGPKRMTLKMQQDVESEQISRNFLNGIRNNVDRESRNKIAGHLLKFGELFAAIPLFQKGDVFTVDWIPSSSSTVLMHNGRKIGEFSEKPFFDAFILCFLGEKPMDPKMKADVLDGK